MSTTDTIAEAFAGLVDAGDRLAALPELVETVRRLADRAQADAAAAAILAVVDEGIHPDHVYSYASAARFCGCAPKTLANQSDIELPRVRRSGRTIGIRGIDILAWRGDISHTEANAYKEAVTGAIRRKVLAA